jgi:hypothetical protein
MFPIPRRYCRRANDSAPIPKKDIDRSFYQRKFYSVIQKLAAAGDGVENREKSRAEKI